MTKIGEGKELPGEPTVEQYRKEFDYNAEKFLNALESFQNATSDEQTHLKAVMDQSLGLIKASISEIKRPGMQKQEVKVENDYKAYLSNASPDNLAALEEDLAILRDYNK